MGRPQIEPVKSEEEYQRRANASVDKLMQFVKDRDVITVKPNVDPAMRAKGQAGRCPAVFRSAT